ncbi:hypothetical protein [Rhodanobacter lindaniclasticus]
MFAQDGMASGHVDMKTDLDVHSMGDVRAPYNASFQDFACPAGDVVSVATATEFAAT